MNRISPFEASDAKAEPISNTPMTDCEIDVIRRRVNLASDGPGNAPIDTEFVANARQDVERLLCEVERLKASRARFARVARDIASWLLGKDQQRAFAMLDTAED
ncbi:hypothetical protein [Symmachiella dynata]|uniref:hypothetical protein n=1 Tax=Symmachiella dynata TaxID=2527995 RepID=UPI0030ECD19B